MNLTFSRTIALVVLLAAGMAACDKKAGVQTRTAATPDASAQVIGKEPAPPTGDPPGTTPVAASTTEMSKGVESNSMPLPGQPNDHSNVAPGASQKASNQETLKSTATAGQANAGTDERSAK